MAIIASIFNVLCYHKINTYNNNILFRAVHKHLNPIFGRSLKSRASSSDWTHYRVIKVVWFLTV